jgi:hypothetical protein
MGLVKQVTSRTVPRMVLLRQKSIRTKANSIVKYDSMFSASQQPGVNHAPATSGLTYVIN